MTKHTPAPWHVEPENLDGDGGTLVRVGNVREGYVCIANVWGIEEATTPDEESLANARLIAASPVMLEALESVENPSPAVLAAIQSAKKG